MLYNEKNIKICIFIIIATAIIIQNNNKVTLRLLSNQSYLVPPTWLYPEGLCWFWPAETDRLLQSPPTRSHSRPWWPHSASLTAAAGRATVYKVGRSFRVKNKANAKVFYRLASRGETNLIGKLQNEINGCHSGLHTLKKWFKNSCGLNSKINHCSFNRPCCPYCSFCSSFVEKKKTMKLYAFPPVIYASPRFSGDRTARTTFK